MKKYIILLFTFCAFGLSSCIKDQGDPFELADAQLAKDEEIIKKFIADNNIAALRHESGLYYQIIEPGSGNVTYSENTNVTVNYKGSFLDGRVFDQSQVGNPISFPLGNVIIGWRIGVPLIQKGGKIRLLIPSGYAYGPQGSQGSIPPNTVLDFDIELLEVR